MELHFAPMQGYVDHVYRRAHASLIGGVDCYYTPFIRMEKGVARYQDMMRLRKSMADGVTTVPQIIFGNAKEFTVLTEALKDEGCSRIDLNLGCPFAMQTGHGRGAAMIGNRATMEAVAAIIEQDKAVTYSVKMRLGMENPHEWHDIIDLLNRLSLSHVTMHPRVARQMYGGELYADEFAQFAAESANPVMWNGDVASASDISRIMTAFPSLKGIMIGRGLLARPTLAAEWREGTTWSDDRCLAAILRLHSQIYSDYSSSLCGATQILQKIKPFWEYLEPTIGHKAYKSIRKATTLERYNQAVAAIG